MNASSPDSSLKEENALAQRLIELLKQEQAHLVRADLNGLEAITVEKSRIVTRMTELTTMRYRALAAAGFSAQEDGMRAWIDAPAPGSDIKQGTKQDAEQAWKELLKLVEAAKPLNKTNGLLIGKHMSYNQSALNVLLGARGGANLYGPNGQSTTKIRARGLVLG